MVKTHILLFVASTLFARILRDICNLLRVGVIKDKIYILKIQDTFVLSSICQKCQGTQIKAFLSFGIKEKYTQRGGSLYISLIPKYKNTLF
jgi:hypothetical protein